MREAILRNLARICARGYKWVLTGAGLIAAAAITLFIVKPPHIQSDILDLLPRHNKVVENFRMAMEDFKSLDYLFIVLRTNDPKGHPIENYEEYADEMAAGLKKSGMVEGVEYKLQDYESVVDKMLPYTLLYLSPRDLGDVAERFSDARIEKQMAFNRQLISNPASLMTKQIIQYDPFGLFPVLKKHFMGKTRQLKIDLSDGYYLSKDGTSLLMIVRPKRPAQDIPFGKKLMRYVAGLEKETRSNWKKDTGESPSYLRVQYGGGYPIAQDDANLIKRDAVVNTISSIILVMLVFVWAFRRKSALVYGWLPLLFGLLLTFAVAHLIGVTINSLTAGFGALLIGLGIDFSIVMYGRYIEARNSGKGVEESISIIMGTTGKGVMVGAVTTAFTFAALLLTSFTGMQQVGIFTSLGILFCAGSVFVLLPAMLYLHHVHKTKKGIEPTFHMHGFGFQFIARWSYKHPKWTLGIAAVLTLAMGISALGIKLEDNVQNLRSPNNKGIAVTKEVGREFGASLTYMMAVVDSSSPQGVLEDTHKVDAAIRPYLKSGDVLFTDSLTTYLPSIKTQDEVLKVLHKDPAGKFSYDRIYKAFTKACEANGFNVEYFSPYLKNLRKMLAPSGPLTYADLEKGPLGPLVSRFIVKKGPDHYRGVVYLYIPTEFKRFAPQGLVRTVEDAVPGARVVGINVLSKVLRGQIKKDALLAFVVGNIVVFLIILLDFRNLRLAFYALVPLAVGLIWMLGSLRFLGESLNMMNIFVTTLILGIGSDYGIHFVHRYMEEDGHDMARVIQEIGVPIVIAALTTIAGFGSMSLSSYPGLRSMGYVSLLGTVYCMLATLTVLVALLTLVDRRKQTVGESIDPSSDQQAG